MLIFFRTRLFLCMKSTNLICLGGVIYICGTFQDMLGFLVLHGEYEYADRLIVGPFTSLA